MRGGRAGNGDADLARYRRGYHRPGYKLQPCTPPVIREVTKAAYRGGAQGLVISRKYSEMKLANLAAVGDALREMKIV